MTKKRKCAAVRLLRFEEGEEGEGFFALKRLARLQGVMMKRPSEKTPLIGTSSFSPATTMPAASSATAVLSAVLL